MREWVLRFDFDEGNHPRSGGVYSCLNIEGTSDGLSPGVPVMDCWSCFQRARRPPASLLAHLSAWSLDPSKLKFEFGRLDSGRGIF